MKHPAARRPDQAALDLAFGPGEYADGPKVSRPQERFVESPETL
jgi:hypothetical protein